MGVFVGEEVPPTPSKMGGLGVAEEERDAPPPKGGDGVEEGEMESAGVGDWERVAPKERVLPPLPPSPPPCEGEEEKEGKGGVPVGEALEETDDVSVTMPPLDETLGVRRPGEGDGVREPPPGVLVPPPPLAGVRVRAALGLKEEDGLGLKVEPPIPPTPPLPSQIA